MRKTYDTKRAIFKGKSYYSFFILLIMVLFVSVLIHVTFFVESDWMSLYLTIFPGLPIIYYVTARIYYRFYLFEDLILIRYPFRFKEKEETISLNNIKYVEFLNNLRGPNIVVVHPINGKIRTNKLQFHDFLNRNVFIFLRWMYSKGIEIDISNCAKQEVVLKKIKGI